MLTDHFFWQGLRIHEHSDNYPQYLAGQPTCEKAKFLTALVDGFYPLSVTSPAIFKHIRDISTDKQVQEDAEAIFQFEMGRTPLVPDSEYANVWHPKQFVTLIESLEVNIHFAELKTSRYPVFAEMDIKNAPMVELVAAADEIEHAAPIIINYLNDFVAQWQVYNKVPTSQIKRTFLDEHALMESNHTEQQHVSVIDRMIKNAGYAAGDKTYEAAKLKFRTAFHKHWDDVTDQMYVKSWQP